MSKGQCCRINCQTYLKIVLQEELDGYGANVHSRPYSLMRRDTVAKDLIMPHGILVLSAAIAGIAFDGAVIFILFCCNLLRVGFSRRLTVDRGWVHRLGIPPPWRRISVSENIIAIGSRTAIFTVVRLLSYEGRFLQIPNSSLYGAAG